MLRPDLEPAPKFLVAHHEVAKVALELANQAFEVYAASNTLYAGLLKTCGTPKRARNAFVNRVAPQYLEDARVVLAACLRDPKLPVTIKDKIQEALELDNELRGLRLVARDRVNYAQYALH